MTSLNRDTRKGQASCLRQFMTRREITRSLSEGFKSNMICLSFPLRTSPSCDELAKPRSLPLAGTAVKYI